MADEHHDRPSGEPDREALRARLNFPSTPNAPGSGRPKADEPRRTLTRRSSPPPTDSDGAPSEVLAQLAALDAKLEKLADRDVVPEWLGDLSARVDRLAEAVELQLGDLAARMHALTERESAPAPVDGAILDPAGAVAEFGQQLADLAVRMDALGERADAIATAPVDPGLLEAIGAIAATQQTLMARLDELARTPGRSGTKPEVVLDLERTVRMVSERVMALSTAAEVRELYILSRLDSLLRAARVEVAEPAAVIDLD